MLTDLPGFPSGHVHKARPSSAPSCQKQCAGPSKTKHAQGSQDDKPFPGSLRWDNWTYHSGGREDKEDRRLQCKQLPASQIKCA